MSTLPATAPALLQQSAVLAAGRAVGVAAAAGTFIVAARVLGPADFGRVAALVAAGAVLAVVVDLGLNAAVVRDIAATGTYGRFAAVVRYKVAAGTVVAIAWAVLAVSVSPFTADKSLAFAPLGLHVAGEFVLAALVQADIARGRAVRPAIVQSSTKLSGLVTTLVMVQATPGPGAVVLGLVAGTAVGVAVAATGVRRELRAAGVGVNLRELLVESRPYWLAGLAAQSQAADSLIVGLIAGPTQAAYLAAPSRVAGPLMLVPAAVATMVLPASAAAAARGGSARRDVLRLVAAGGAVMAVVLGGLAVMAPIIVTTVFGPAFEPAVTPMRVILAALLLAALNPPLVSMLQGEGQAAEVARVMSVAAVAGLLAVLVGAQWGASGASWSVLIVQSIVLGQLLHLVRAPSPSGATVLEPAR